MQEGLSARSRLVNSVLPPRFRRLPSLRGTLNIRANPNRPNPRLDLDPGMVWRRSTRSSDDASRSQAVLNHQMEEASCSSPRLRRPLSCREWALPRQRRCNTHVIQIAVRTPCFRWYNAAVNGLAPSDITLLK